MQSAPGQLIATSFFRSLLQVSYRSQQSFAEANLETHRRPNRDFRVGGRKFDAERRATSSFAVKLPQKPALPSRQQRLAGERDATQ